MKSVSLLFSLSFQGERTGKGYQGCFDGWPWSLLLPGMFWLAGLATTGSKSVLHLPYLSSPACLFVSHLSLPFPSPFHSKLCAPRELSMCTRQARVTLGFLRSWCARFQPLHGAGEQWQEDWPPPKTSASSCTAGLYWPPRLRQETQKLPTCRTLAVHSEQIPLPKRPTTPYFTILFPIKQTVSAFALACWRPCCRSPHLLSMASQRHQERSGWRRQGYSYVPTSPATS